MPIYNDVEIREYNGGWAIADVANAIGMSSGNLRRKIENRFEGPESATGVRLSMAKVEDIQKALVGARKKTVQPFLDWIESLDSDPYTYPVASEDAYAVTETMDSQLFDFGGHNVRVVMDERKEPWFVLKDVCDVLELPNVGMVKERIMEADISSTDVRSETAGQNRSMLIVNESGLYDVIFQSRKPEAKRFRRWVTNEVLPSIRKTGAYLSDTILDSSDPWSMLEFALNEGKKLRDEIRAKEAELEAAQPAIEFHSWVGVSGESIQVRDLAALISRNGVRMTQNQLFSELRERGFLVKNRSRNGFVNNPTMRSIDEGLLELVEYKFYDPYGNERFAKRTDVTPAGQEFFLNLFINEPEEVYA